MQERKSRWKRQNQFKGRTSAAYSSGERPRLEKVYYTTPLDAYALPPFFLDFFNQEVIDATKLGVKTKEVMLEVTEGFEVPAEYLWRLQSAKEFANFYEHLLFVEECQMKIDIRMYDAKQVKLVPVNHAHYALYKVVVPGLAEGRPSVLRGDPIYAYEHGCFRIHKGYAHFINLDNIHVSFCSRSLPNWLVKALKFDLEFTFTRTPLRIMHRAIRDEDLIQERLFTPTSEKYRYPEKPLKLNNPLLNEEQQLAVQTVVRNPSRMVIVHGPPGTGKTSTLIEMMAQILQRNSRAKILACSSSNEAADLMCNRILKYVPASSVLRLKAISRAPIKVDPAIMHVTTYDGSSFDIPSMNYIKKKSIVFSTCITAGKLIGMGMEQSFFTHVIVDEAGEAMVPETMVALQLAGKAVIIIAGDSKQLGPIIRSHTALAYKFDISLLEYLTDYSQVENKTIFHLKKTYRGHPDIVHLYSTMFYAGTLQPKASPEKTNCLLSWNRFRSNSPILIKHVEGTDERDADSPSWYNLHEVNTVIGMIDDMMKARLVEPQDIYIITPYRKQVQKFRQALNSVRYDGIQVGTVEHFQGKENKLIMISTVRSTSQYLKLDKKFKLGFLDNPKRLNVSISRAIAGLVVVGNMKILYLDDKWKEFIHLAMEKKSYIGPNFKNGEERERALRETMGMPEEEAEENVDAPWKDRE